MSDETIFDVKKITPRYDRLRNAIRLDMQSLAGATQSLLLTQPLHDALVAELVKKIDLALKERMKVDGVVGMQIMEQSIAQSAFKASSPVRPEKTEVREAHFIRSIDLSETTQGYFLIFKWQEIARLHLTVIQTRQWLGVLRKTSIRAGWPQHIWPQWLTEEALIYKSNQIGSLH